MVTISEDKAQLRREALARRAALDPALRAAFSERLKTLGLDLAARHPRLAQLARSARPRHGAADHGRARGQADVSGFSARRPSCDRRDAHS
jgi:hypothetical protein